MDSAKGLDLHIPDSIVEAIRLPRGRVKEELMLELALALYAQGLLSLGKARELVGMDKRAFGQLLGERGILRHYGPEELHDDLSYARGE